MDYTILTSFTRFKFNGKYKMFGNSQNIILRCVYRSNISIKWLQEILQQLDGDYSGCAMKIALVAWVDHRAGMQCSLAPLSSLSTVPYSRNIQWPTRNFLLPCAASTCTQAYCFGTVLFIKIQ